MSTVDARGCSISGATPAALEAYEHALAAFQSWRRGSGAHLAVALREAPGFVMAHVLQAYLHLSSRDPGHVRLARPVLARAAELPANDRERLHLAAISASIADHYERAKARWTELLSRYPRDVLALQAAHAFDYITGDLDRMNDRVAAVLPAWSSELPGYHAVLAMHAFSLEECGHYGRAEEAARAALALNAFDARAHHAMAHVFEMSERPAAGVRWMNEHFNAWAVDTAVSTHCWWHLALFHLAQGQLDQAVTLYDQRVRARRSIEIADMIDASALLWRVHLLGGNTGTRWGELADAWEPTIGDDFCSFNDLHAMVSFVGARDWDRARRLELAVERAAALPTRYGETTRLLGLPACRALIAFGHRNDRLAIALLASLPAHAHRLGGSHAQRDVLNLTLLHAIKRIRWATRRFGKVRLRISAPVPPLAPA